MRDAPGLTGSDAAEAPGLSLPWVGNDTRMDPKGTYGPLRSGALGPPEGLCAPGLYCCYGDEMSLHSSRLLLPCCPVALMPGGTAQGPHAVSPRMKAPGTSTPKTSSAWPRAEGAHPGELPSDSVPFA